MISKRPRPKSQPELKEFVQALALRRGRRKMTQAVLAEKAGTTQATVSGVERCQSNPTIGLLQDLAQAVGGELHISIRDKE